MPAIRILPSEVANRIAAGEVVERPASVVKELVENALDAGASRVSVEIEEGGMRLIRITDDGCGIEPEEMARAFERHATSKLADDADLARILTLGFRGEALPSIAAVADVEMVSRPAHSEAAAHLRLQPGYPLEHGSRGAPVGTTLTVSRIFEHLPARRKFLRSASSEANAIASAVTHYALAYPEVRFRLAVDGRQTFATPGSGDLRDAVAAVYGLDTGAAMLEVHPGDGEIRVTGLAGPPHLSRSTRAYVSLYVNRRWIQNRRLVFAVEEAYRGMLMVGRHPIAVLNIGIPHEEVDVNVHPTKAEVRFRDESAVFGALQKAVRAALTLASPVPAGVGAGATITPEPLTLTAQPWSPPLWEAAVRREESVGTIGTQHVGHHDNAALHQNGTNTDVDPDHSRNASANGPNANDTHSDTLPVLRVIGQYGSVYIIAEGPEGMYLIDQHAAHERVLYERFCTLRASQQPDAQGLLDPLPLDLSPRQRALVAREAETLVAHGFSLEPFGENSYIARAVPRPLARGDVRENITRFLDEMLEEEPDDTRDRVAMSLACHGAVRAGKTLTPEEMRDLVRQLEDTQAPQTCPHGRPTMVHVSAETLARGFGRR